MAKQALLVLEDGSSFRGEAFGSERPAAGEVVFNTSMTGYQEILTDPSYGGQIVVFTYPLIGNYGITREDFESARVRAAGMVVREYCELPSNWRSERTVDEFLKAYDVIGISGVDTRALTRRLRSRGVMMGVITTELSEARALAELRARPSYGELNLVETVSTERAYPWPVDEGSGGAWETNLAGEPPDLRPRRRVVVLDLGLKHNICRHLEGLGCHVTILPWQSTAEDLLAGHPDGVLLSPGPGDPALLERPVEEVRRLIGRVPLMGICLGHQMLSRALGAKTFKLKFGHHGGNHPVKDLETGEVHITSQNHGYAVDPETLPASAEVSHLNLNDYTVEGIRHREHPLISIQYHSEAAPGPRDNAYLFRRFMELIDSGT